MHTPYYPLPQCKFDQILFVTSAPDKKKRETDKGRVMVFVHCTPPRYLEPLCEV